MSETWATAILTASIVIASGILGWLVNELRHFRTEFVSNTKELYQKIEQLNRTLDDYVKKKDCDIKMSDHCEQMDEVRKDIKENTRILERIIQYHKQIGQPID